MLMVIKTKPPARGFSLIELMVGLAIGLLVIVIVIQGFASASSTASKNSSMSEALINGSYALEFLKREIRHATPPKLIYRPSTQISPGTGLDTQDYGCGTNFITLDHYIEASSSNPYANSCLKSSSALNYLQGDVLILRRTALAETFSSQSTSTPSYDTNAPYIRFSYAQGTLFKGNNTPPTVLTPPWYDYRIVHDIYFINSFTGSESPQVPALYRLTLQSGDNPTMAPELIASNVEHIKFQFGIADSTTGSIQYIDSSNPTISAQWPSVISVRLWLLIRDSKLEPGFSSGTYTFGNFSYTPTDHFRRVALTTTIGMR